MAITRSQKNTPDFELKNFSFFSNNPRARVANFVFFVTGFAAQ
jgi:hypothetical protein